MGSSEVRVLLPGELMLWDDLVNTSPCGSIFHSAKWITTCADLLGFKEYICGYFDDGDLVGGCSLYANNKYWIFKVGLSTPPQTPYGGYCIRPPESSSVRGIEQYRNTIVSKINAELTHTFDYINIVNTPEFGDIRPFIWNGWTSSVRYLYYFDLNDRIGSTISRNVMRNVRKGEKNGITIAIENDADVLYSLLEKTFAKQNLPVPVPRAFLSRMVDVIVASGAGEIWTARTLSGDPAAAEMVLWDNKRAYRWQAAEDPELRDTGAPSLLLFEILRDLNRRGISKINLMAANRPQLAEYASNFNPRLVPYYNLSIKKSFRKKVSFR